MASARLELTNSLFIIIMYCSALTNDVIELACKGEKNTLARTNITLRENIYWREVEFNSTTHISKNLCRQSAICSNALLSSSDYIYQIYIYSNASLWVQTNEAYWPFLASNSKWVPSSAILPSEQSAIWCAFWTVLNLWAITNVVLPFIRWFRASWTKRSLTASSALVACCREHHVTIRNI